MTVSMYLKHTKIAAFAEEMRKLAKQSTETKEVVKDLGAGAAAGALASLAVFPIDTVADAIKPGSTFHGQSAMNVAKSIYKSHGVKGFYSGAGIKLLKIAPAQAITLALYAAMRKHDRKSKQ